MVLIKRPGCGAWKKNSTGRLVLSHQQDWRSDLHCCRSLKNKKKKKKKKKEKEEEEEEEKKKKKKKKPFSPWGFFQVESYN